MENKGRILVIDDELGIREGCRRALTPEGYQVDIAATIKEGQQRIEEGEYDLVLLDVMMPDGSGIEMLQFIRKKDPEIVCVIITGYATVELAVSAIKKGAYDFISKPFTADMLQLTVSQGMERRRLIQDTLRLKEVEKEAEQLTRAKKEMERLDRFKSAFMLVVAHELRSPVGGAQSLIRTLIRGLAGEVNEKQKDILRRIDNRMDILMELINDLLSLAASKTAENEQSLVEVDLLALLNMTVEHFQIEAENKGINLEYKAGSRKPVIQATEDGIEKILRNLIGNAVKYTPAGGKVKVNAVESDHQIQIDVADTGIGIPEEDLQRIGEEFFRAKNAKKSEIQGTGLGLSIVKQYIDRFRGEMKVASEMGKGTTFSVILPCTYPEN